MSTPVFPPKSGTPVTPLNIKRRRALTATAAALSLAGCNMLGQNAMEPKTRDQIEAERRVKAYQADIESALDKVDRERLRAAAEKKATVPVIAANPAPAAPAPVVAPAPAPTYGTTGAASPVILASSSGVPATLAWQPPETGHSGAGALKPVSHAAAGHAADAHAAVAPAADTHAAAGPPAAPRAADPHAAPAAPAAATPAAATVSPAESGGIQPLSVPATMGVVVSPMSGDTHISPSIIAPFTPPSTPGVTAMTAMVAAGQITAVEPAAIAPAAPAEASLDDALGVLRKNVGEHPTLNTALALALLDGGRNDAIKKLPESDQKVLTDLLAALEVMQTKTTAPTLAERAAPIMDAAKHWQEDADLALPRMVLATRVDSFGVFTPVAGIFEQGKRHTVIIYCEVANFASKKSDDGWYTTKLSQQETLFTDDGLLIWRPNVEEVEDRSLNQRHDFYLVKKLTIPESLAAGKYMLRMSVTDRNTNKIKIVEMPLELKAAK